VADLATISDLENRLGRSLTAEETARAAALLADASAMIRGYTRQDFDQVVDDQVVLRPVGTVLRLPQRPVTAVSQVVALGGGVIPDLTLPAGLWTWDGVDQVDIWPPETDLWLSLPARWADVGWPVDTYRVTYSHGYATVPQDVVAVACAMVLRVLVAPSLVEGMVSERIGSYFYQLQQGSGSAGPGVRLTNADRDALARYRRTATTIQVAL